MFLFVGSRKLFSGAKAATFSASYPVIKRIGPAPGTGNTAIG